MDNNSDQHSLQQLLDKIEADFNRGSGGNWTTYDFDKLSDSIFERTQVRLSVTTLKRIWGRLKYDSAPTLTTLNTLAQFAGFVDWRDFKHHILPRTEAEIVPAPRRSRRRLLFGIGGTGVVITAIYLLFLSAGPKATTYDPNQFDFRPNKILSEGVPNSVIFNYRARVIPDSLFIVQTWDLRRKTLVPADKHEHSAIYYYPGFFKTKLIADNQVVKTQDLWITSNGWLCLLENEPAPVYFKKEDCLRNGVVQVTDSMLAPYHNSQVRFFNQKDMGELMNDNFSFETTVKNEFDDGSNTCHKAQVLIQCKNDIIIIPLAAKACVGDLSLYFCGAHAESKSADLSGFGCDLTKWTTLKIETVNKVATIYVNDKKAYSLAFPNDATGIVGVQYRFNGSSAVQYARFTTKGKTYELE